MNFLSPWSLLLLLPLAGVVILLYLLKLRRREQVVSSVFLWRDAVADIQANAPFQKLKKNLLLFLQLLALLLLVLGVARPFMRVQGIHENKIVLILDTSASMQSKDVSPSRFEAAKSRARKIADRMGPGDTMMVITAGSKARVAASFTSDKRALAGAISNLRPTDAGCNMREAMLLALSLTAGKSRTPARIMVLSDGGFGALEDLTARNAKTEFVRIGKSCDNVGITGLSSRKTFSGEQEIFIGMRNFGERKRTFNLELYLNDNLLNIREETLGPGEAKQEILGNVGNLTGRVTAKLDVKDDLEVDNSGSVYLSGPRRVSVLLVSKGNIFIQNALNLDPRTQLVRADSLPSEFEKQQFDIVVFDGVKPPSNLPPGGYLLVNTSAAQGPAEAGASVTMPTIIDSARNHPVSAYVDFGNARIQGASYLKPKPWGVPLVEGPDGPLVVAGSRGGRSFVQVGWDLLESDFPLRVGFPIFIANCLDWLAPPERSGGGMTARTGRPVYIDVPPAVDEITVTDPSGAKQTVKVVQTPVAYDNTDLAGLYRVEGKGFKKEFTCNLASSGESDTRPEGKMLVGGEAVESSGAGVRTNREYWWPLLLIALGVLAFEWYAYHRRL